MAIEKIIDAESAFFHGHRDKSMEDATQALKEGRTEDAVTSMAHAATIEALTTSVIAALRFVNQAHERLGLDPLSIEALGIDSRTIPAVPVDSQVEHQVVVSPDAVKEEPSLENSNPDAISSVPVPANLPEPAVPPVEDLPDSRAAVIPESPSQPVTHVPSGLRSETSRHSVDQKPQRQRYIVRRPGEASPASPEKMKGESREERVMRAAWGLNTSMTNTNYNSFPNSVTGAYLDVLPPLTAPDHEKREAFGKAMVEHNGVLNGMVEDFRAYSLNPQTLTGEKHNWVRHMLKFLKSEGYPEDITAKELFEIGSRRGKLYEDFIIILHSGGSMSNRLALKASQAENPPPTQKPAVSESRRVAAAPARVATPARALLQDNKQPIPQTGSVRAWTATSSERDQQQSSDEDRRRARSNKAVVPVYSVGVPRTGEVRVSEQDVLSNALAESLFAINQDKTHRESSLRDVAMKAYTREFEGLEGARLEAKIQEVIKTRITPYIVSRMRAYTLYKNPHSGGIGVVEKRLAGELEFLMGYFHYPTDLSPKDIGNLMSRQTNIVYILAARRGAFKAMPGSGQPDNNTNGQGEPVTDSAPVVELKNKKDRLTDAQRNYWDVVYATNGGGEIKYPNRELARQVLYSDSKDSQALQLAHMGRTGNALKRMLEIFFAGGEVPAELRAKIRETREKPAFKDLPNDVFIALSQR